MGGIRPPGPSLSPWLHQVGGHSMGGEAHHPKGGKYDGGGGRGCGWGLCGGGIRGGRKANKGKGPPRQETSYTDKAQRGAVLWGVVTEPEPGGGRPEGGQERWYPPGTRGCFMDTNGHGPVSERCCSNPVRQLAGLAMMRLRWFVRKTQKGAASEWGGPGAIRKKGGCRKAGCSFDLRRDKLGEHEFIDCFGGLT